MATHDCHGMFFRGIDKLVGSQTVRITIPGMIICSPKLKYGLKDLRMLFCIK